MPTAKLIAKLPGDDTDDNGLDAYLSHYRKHPYDQVVAVVYLSTAKLLTNYAGDSAGVTPYLQIDAAEVIGVAGDLGAGDSAIEAFRAVRTRRLDRQPNLVDAAAETTAQADTDTPTPEVLALTDGVDLEASLRQVEDIVDGEIVEGICPECRQEGACPRCARAMETCPGCGHSVEAHDNWSGCYVETVQDGFCQCDTPRAAL